MSFTAGDFTASALQGTVQARIDTLVVDPTQKHLVKDTSIINELYTQPTLIAQSAEQAAFFSDARRCADLKISWLLDGDVAAPNAAGTATFCDPDGPEIGSDSVTYAKPSGKEKTFKVLTDTCLNQYDFAQKVAYGFLSKRAILVEQLEKDSAAFLVANTDDLTGVSVPKGGVTNSVWNIGAISSGTDAERVKDLIHIRNFARKQRMIAPTMVLGERFLYEDQVFTATAGGGTSDHRSILAKGDMIRDIDYMDAATTTQDIMLIDKQTYAYVNYTWAQNTSLSNKNMVLNHPMQYYISDPVLKVWDPVKRAIVPFKWDVTQVWKCNAYNQFAVVYTITGRGGHLKMPKDVTGKIQSAQIKFADNA